MNLVDDGFEGIGIVKGKVGKHLTVDFDAVLMDKAHELGVAESILTGSGIDALNPKGTEITFFILAVAVGIGETLFPGVLCNGPYIAAGTKVTAG